MSNAQTMAAYIAGAGQPASVTIADDIHIFHFEADGNWRQAKLLFVNRNGHHFRVIEEDGDFHFIKTWNGMLEFADWMMPGLSRKDAVELIQMCGVGPQNPKGPQFEGLCLLPREATKGRRRAAWRGHLLALGFDRNNDTFTLYPSRTGAPVSSFRGKPWESREAAAWCAQTLASVPLNRENVGATTFGHVDPTRAPDPVAEKELEEALVGVWGMF
jgi:hypothetical protein